MQTHVHDDADSLGKAAATEAARRIRTAISNRGGARILLATGASQFEMLGHLVEQPDIDWGAVTMFHLDEYIGIDERHPASFARYLRERFVEKVPPLAAAHFLAGDTGDAPSECDRMSDLVAEAPIDIGMVGIGENGHLAFNDPPADFETEKPYLVVKLDEACRHQQLGEGWFPDFESVPASAISMSVRQIMKSRHLIVSVPHQRKAQAVKNTLDSHADPNVPASILHDHPNCDLHLDRDSASML